MTLKDQQARDRIRQDLDTTLIVEAAAGTGKTTELVNRIIGCARIRTNHRGSHSGGHFHGQGRWRIKLRLREELEKARTAAGNTMSFAAEIWNSALAHLEEARAGTIHSFCGDLLRERPVEAGIDPQFEQLDETTSEQHYAVCISHVDRADVLGKPAGEEFVDRFAAIPRMMSRWRGSRELDGPWQCGAIRKLPGPVQALTELAISIGS